MKRFAYIALILVVIVLSVGCTCIEQFGEVGTTFRDFMLAGEAKDFDKLLGLTTSSMDCTTLVRDNYYFFENYEDIHMHSIHIETTGGQSWAYFAGVTSYTDGYEVSFETHMVKRGGVWRIDSIKFFVDPDKVRQFFQGTSS